MKQFKDAQGREWEICVNVMTVKRVRDVLDVDVLKLFDDEGAKVMSDPCTLVNVLYVLCQKQAEGKGVDDVAFGEAMVGNALEDGANALLEDVILFFPESRRVILRKVLEKSKAYSETVTAKALTILETLDPTHLKSPTNSQDSSV